jgi:hypothetical protein
MATPQTFAAMPASAVRAPPRRARTRARER